jgi:hypothetical protein
LFLSVKLIMGMMTSCTCAKISGELSMAEMIYTSSSVSAGIKPQGKATHRPNSLRNPHRGVRLVVVPAEGRIPANLAELWVPDRGQVVLGEAEVRVALQKSEWV